MWQQSELRPDLYETVIIVATTNSLSRHLERELLQIELGNLPVGRLKDIYDTLYLPAGSALADGLDLFTSTADWDLLRQPFCQELATTQLRLVLELLYGVAWMFRETNAS
jgi:hypothetical protein